MDFYRAKEYDPRIIKYEQSFLHSTALIAGENEKVYAVFEYDIKNIYEAEVVNFSLLEPCEENMIFRGFIDEMEYWNPYIKILVYNDKNNLINRDVLTNLGFSRSFIWSLELDNDTEVFKVNINDITPEQLTIDTVKLEKVKSWIEKPEDVIVSCVKIDDKTVSIDGHSRLVAACDKGLDYVYGYWEKDADIEFFKECLRWCKEQNILTIRDLTGRVVTPEEHQRIWCDRCQEYLRDHDL